MTDHMFPIHSVVTFRPVGQSTQAFTVVRHLPAEQGGPQYRLRSNVTGQERIVEEVLLTNAIAAP